MKPLKIKTSENVNAQDKIYTYKWWFNGIKHFFTVKILPPRQ